MTCDDIIRMTRKACIAKHGMYWTCQQEELEHFAALVAAAQREAMIKAGWRQCAEGQRTTQFCALLEAAVKAEREACAKVAESYEPTCDTCPSGVANAIRARGDK